MITLDEFFEPFPQSCVLFEALLLISGLSAQADMRVMKSQIVFKNKRDFAWVWIPGRYLTGRQNLAPLVLSLAFPFRDESPHWKEIVEPYPGRFVHHLELFSPDDIDEWVLERIVTTAKFAS